MKNKKTKFYILSETELKELLEGFLTAEALGCGGVDNWEWYCDSIHDYLTQTPPYYQTIEDMAETCLRNYAELEDIDE